MQILYTAEVEGRKYDGKFPNWSIDLLQDCHYAAKVIVQAVKNESKSDCGLTKAGFVNRHMSFQGGLDGRSTITSRSCATLHPVAVDVKIGSSGTCRTYFRLTPGN